MIQILPVFDTISTQTWVDSYPYGAITVFGLHPMYVNLQTIKGISKEIFLELGQIKKNTTIQIDYEETVRVKLEYLKRIYTDVISETKETEYKKIKEWINEAPEIQYWIRGYCIFKYLAECYGNVDFNTWADCEQLLITNSPYKHDQFLQMDDTQK